MKEFARIPRKTVRQLLRKLGYASFSEEFASFNQRLKDLEDALFGPNPGASKLNELKLDIEWVQRQQSRVEHEVAEVYNDVGRLRDTLTGLQQEVRDVERLREDFTGLRQEVREVEQLRESLTGLQREVNEVKRKASELTLAVERTKSRLDVDDGLVEAFELYRASDQYGELFQKSKPTVSVCIATYNRSTLLTERCLPSVLAQNYAKVNVIVVGDGCSDDTEGAIARLKSPLVRFINLTERERYPSDPDNRWMVAGTAASNVALNLADGDLITHLDDDDEMSPESLSELVNYWKSTKAEFIWFPFWYEDKNGDWLVNEAEPFEHSRITTGSAIYINWLKHIPWDPFSYRYREPGDWNRYRKIRDIGARLARYPEPLLRHHRERNQ